MSRLPPGAARGTACLTLLGAVMTASANPPVDWAIGPDGRPLERQTITVDLPPRPLRIAILPDRTTGRAWGLPYLRAAVLDLERLQPDVIFTIGDMVQGYTRSVARWNEEVAEWKAIVEPLDRAPFPVAGNHDVVSGSRDPADDAFETLYREAFGPLRYAVDLPARRSSSASATDGGRRRASRSRRRTSRGSTRRSGTPRRGASRSSC